jgi:hypothetical protein
MNELRLAAAMTERALSTQNACQVVPVAEPGTEPPGRPLPWRTKRLGVEVDPPLLLSLRFIALALIFVI